MYRIRYEKTNDPNILRSVKTYRLNGKDIRVMLHTNDLAYGLVDITSDETLDYGKAVSVPQLKVKAKEALSKLGVEFAAESRPRETAENTLA